MEISYNWLKKYIDGDLPNPEKLAEVLTLHAVEVEGIKKVGKDHVLDIDVLPNRAHDCLSHRGIAREAATLLDVKLKETSAPYLLKKKGEADFSLTVKNSDICRRYMGVVIDGIEVKDSPVWLKEQLEVLGQRSINNIVDATNYVLLSLGQPLHAFDLEKVEGREIIVRNAKKGECITTLDDKEVELGSDMLVIADSKDALAIAGVKGGKKAEVDESTTRILLESANFEPVSIRKTAAQTGIRTDASKRFENEITPHLAEEALGELVALILDIASGKNTSVGVTLDEFPRVPQPYMAGISQQEVNDILGIDLTESDIIEMFERLHLGVKKVDPVPVVLKEAEKLKGLPYTYGASVLYDAPKSFDCTSFTAYIFTRAGLQIPRMVIDQYVFCDEISPDDAKPGDIVFSNTGVVKRITRYESVEFMPGTKVTEGVDHLGLYLGDGKVMHFTESEGKGLIEEINKSEKFKNVVGYGRVPGVESARFVVEIPHERLDLRIKEDLAEEVGRLHGYEHLKERPPVDDIVAVPMNPIMVCMRQVREIMRGAGFSEVYNYSFLKRGEIELANPLASDKKFLRNNLIGGLKLNVEENLKYQENVMVFEIGKVFSSVKGHIQEELSFSAIIGQKKQKEEILKDNFSRLKGLLEAIFDELGIRNAEFKNGGGEIIATIHVDGELMGTMLINAFELNLEKVVATMNNEITYRAPSKYPSIIRDVSLYVPFETSAGEVEQIIRDSAGELLAELTLFDVFEGDERKSFAFRMLLQSPERTLSDTEANEVSERVIDALEANNSQWEVRK